MNEDGKDNLVQSMEELMDLEEAPEISTELMEKHGIDLPAIRQDHEHGGVKEDMAYSRANLKKMIDNTEPVLETLTELARRSESARMFEVLGQIMRVIMDANMGLMDIQKKGNQVMHLDPKGRNPNRKSNHEGGDTYNTLYIGSTQDLQKFLKNRDKEEKEAAGNRSDTKVVSDQ